MTEIRTKRVYLPADADDGSRVLVDRLWPRGVRRDRAVIDEWFKDLAPSSELRRWFGHAPERWDAFRHHYLAELLTKDDALEPLRALIRTRQRITLLFAAKEELHNNAVVLAEYLRSQRPR